MRGKISTTCLLIGTLLAPIMAYADADVDRSHPATFVKDSVITAKIKSKLAAEHFTSLTKIKVDTDKAGAVWLSGSSATQADADKAVSIARETEGVISVKSDITINPSR